MTPRISYAAFLLAISLGLSQQVVGQAGKAPRMLDCTAYGMIVACDGSWFPKTVRDDSVCKSNVRRPYDYGDGWACANGFGVQVVQPVQTIDIRKPKKKQVVGEAQTTTAKGCMAGWHFLNSYTTFSGTIMQSCAKDEPKPKK